MAPDDPPSVVVLAGPNGAGKSTAAPHLLHAELGIDEFVNADEIARGLSGFKVDRPAFAAGRIMLERIRELAGEHRTFSFETTLASRTFAPLLRALKARGYRTHLLFLHLPSAEAAVGRVRLRVTEGGHSVPEEVVRRRYRRGLRNLFNLYLPVVDAWVVYDNGGPQPLLIARSDGRIGQSATWNRLRAEYGND